MKALVYSHFSRTEALSAKVSQALEGLGRCTDLVSFISTSALSNEAKSELSPFCNIVIERDNVGYDFYSWKTGLEALGPREDLTEVIVVNDSVIGPFGDSAELFERLRSDPRDVCGLTLSWEGGRHVQSYFIRFGEAVIRSGAFDAFWESVEPLSDKQQVIDRYELGLTPFMEQRGHSVGALFEAPAQSSLLSRTKHWAGNVDLRSPTKALRSLRRTIDADGLNPTIDLWRECLDAGIPFVKRQLLRDNPGGINLDRVTADIERRFGTQPELLLEWAAS